MFTWAPNLRGLDCKFYQDKNLKFEEEYEIKIWSLQVPLSFQLVDWGMFVQEKLAEKSNNMCLTQQWQHFYFYKGRVS